MTMMTPTAWPTDQHWVEIKSRRQSKHPDLSVHLITQPHRIKMELIDDQTPTVTNITFNLLRIYFGGSQNL